MGRGKKRKRMCKFELKKESQEELEMRGYRLMK
jgi:hypothetical protein